jgi:hypothetical protein
MARVDGIASLYLPVGRIIIEYELDAGEPVNLRWYHDVYPHAPYEPTAEDIVAAKAQIQKDRAGAPRIAAAIEGETPWWLKGSHKDGLD